MFAIVSFQYSAKMYNAGKIILPKWRLRITARNLCCTTIYCAANLNIIWCQPCCFIASSLSNAHSRHTSRVAKLSHFKWFKLFIAKQNTEPHPSYLPHFMFCFMSADKRLLLSVIFSTHCQLICRLSVLFLVSGCFFSLGEKICNNNLPHINLLFFL